MQRGTASRPAGNPCRPGRAGRCGPGRRGAGGAPTHPAGGAPTCTYSLRTPGSRDSAVSRRLSVPWATHSSSTSRKMKSPAEERHPKTSTAGPSAWPWRRLSARSCQNPWEGGRRGGRGGWGAAGGRGPAARAPRCVRLRRPSRSARTLCKGPPAPEPYGKHERLTATQPWKARRAAVSRQQAGARLQGLAARAPEGPGPWSRAALTRKGASPVPAATMTTGAAKLRGCLNAGWLTSLKRTRSPFERRVM
jgi:hypothetical protein